MFCWSIGKTIAIILLIIIYSKVSISETVTPNLTLIANKNYYHKMTHKNVKFINALVSNLTKSMIDLIERPRRTKIEKNQRKLTLSSDGVFLFILTSD